MAMNSRRNPLSALLDYANARGDEASSIGSVMTQLASPILKGQGVQVDNAVQRGPVPQPTLVEFNTTSKERLAGADPRLSDFMTEVERRASEQGINMQIAETNRSAERQAEMVASGKSQTQNSHHLTGNAADIYLVGPDGKPNYNFDDYKPVADIAKEVAAERGLTDFQWGGDWTTLKDGVHFQLGGSPNLNTTVSTMGAPEAGGGALPQTVEGILSTLYPDAAEDEKAAHRKDIWRGLSQGLSALSQGGQVDLSNIATNADTRRRQNVLDMRERERARSAASLIYSETGNADMAAAIATGAMSVGEAFSEKERKRVAEQADKQRLEAENSRKALGDLVISSADKLGWDKSATDAAIKAIDAGVDLSSIFSLKQTETLAEESRKKEDAADEAKAQRQGIIEEYASSTDPVLKLTTQLMMGNPDVSFTDAYKLASDRFPVAKEGGDKGFEFEAQIAARMKALNEDEATATRAVLEQQQKAGATNLTIGPDGKITVTQGAVGAPAAGGVPATSGAPAAAGIGGAFGAQFGSTAPGYVTAMGPNGLQTVPVPGAPQVAANEADLAATIAGTAATEQATAQDTAEAPLDYATLQADLALKLQEVEAKKAAAPTVAAQSVLDTEAKDIANQQAALNLQIAQSSQFVDAKTKQTALAAAEWEVKNAKKAYDDAVATAKKAEQDAAALASEEYAYADRQFAVAKNSADQVFKNGLGYWTTGMGGKLTTGLLGGVLSQTDRTDFLAAVKTMGAQSMFDALIKAKDAGVTLTPVSNLDLTALGESVSRLATPETLKGETIIKDAAFQMNYMTDALYGPKDLERYDEYGLPYQVGQNTLGVTEDTFARHWLGIPPDVKAAWKSGEITDFPTDDPVYAEAAKTINTMMKNYELYQGPVDRSVVGSAEPPASGSTEPPPANLPVPEGKTAEEWAGIWAELSPAVRAAYEEKFGGSVK